MAGGVGRIDVDTVADNRLGLGKLLVVNTENQSQAKVGRGVAPEAEFDGLAKRCFSFGPILHGQLGHAQHVVGFVKSGEGFDGALEFGDAAGPVHRIQTPGSLVESLFGFVGDAEFVDRNDGTGGIDQCRAAVFDWAELTDGKTESVRKQNGITREQLIDLPALPPSDFYCEREGCRKSE